MTNSRFNLKEHYQRSSNFAHRIRERWGVDYHSVEGIHRGLLALYPDLLSEPKAVETLNQPQPIDDAERRSIKEASRVGENVFSLEAYRERREHIIQQSEELGSQRLMDEARLKRDAAFDDPRDNERFHEYDLPA